MRKRNRVRIRSAILIIIALGLAEYLYLAHINGSDSTDQSKGHEDQEYTGSESCQSCHATQYTDWKNSHHAQAMSAATAGTVKGDFNTTFTSQGVTSRFFRDGDKFFVNTEGPDGARRCFSAVKPA